MPDPDEFEDDAPLPADVSDIGTDLPFSSADFHNVVQKHILNAVYETLVETKLDWELVAPFLHSARDICRADFEEASEIRLHVVKADGDQWVEAEEAYLGISVADRDDGEEWLAQTYWLSEIATAEEDPEQVRAIVRGLERTIGRLNGWLAEKEAGGGGEAPPE